MTTKATELLIRWRQGEQEALEQLTQLLYSQLRNIAKYHLGKENKNHTLQPTELVHIAFEKLIGLENVDWKSKAHFFAVSSNIMRRILVDHARAKLTHKRKSNLPLMSEDEVEIQDHYVDILQIDDLMTQLSNMDERKGKLAELHYFGGLSHEETAETMGISMRTVQRELQLAKAWINSEFAMP